MEVDMAARVKRVEEWCRIHDSADHHYGLHVRHWTEERMEASQLGYYYCPLLKAGSTFFRRLFYAIERNMEIKSPFDIDIKKALEAKRTTLTKLSVRDRKILEANATAIMWVRDPYTRLLSGYVDKLFAPNPYFWKMIGGHIITTHRQGSEHGKCFSDVTFPEFVKYVLESERTNSTFRDAHFTPAWDQCKPCAFNYSVYGRMESFR